MLTIVFNNKFSDHKDRAVGFKEKRKKAARQILRTVRIVKLCEITFTIVNESLTSFLILRPSSKLFKTFLKEKWNKRLLGYGDQHHS